MLTEVSCYDDMMFSFALHDVGQVVCVMCHVVIRLNFTSILALLSNKVIVWFFMSD